MGLSCQHLIPLPRLHCRTNKWRLSLSVPASVARRPQLGCCGARRTHQSLSSAEEHNPTLYEMEGTLIRRWRFTLRYKPVDLGILQAALVAIGRDALTVWIRAEPTGTHSRRASFSMKRRRVTRSLYRRRRRETRERFRTCPYAPFAAVSCPHRRKRHRANAQGECSARGRRAFLFSFCLPRASVERRSGLPAVAFSSLLRQRDPFSDRTSSGRREQGKRPRP